MADFNTSKVDGAGNTVAAAEWNQFADIDNIITTSGQTPASGDLNQLGIAAARYSSGGQFYTDSGTANAYVLAPVSPFKAPVDATNTYFNGMIIRFRAGNANTGASTVNVNGAGVKNLKKADGTDLTTGDILTNNDVMFRYDGTNFVKVENINPATTTIRGISYLSNPITIANNTTDANNDIDFTDGNFQFSDNSSQAFASGMTKRLDASWSAGNNNGGLDTGTKQANTWYHCYAIYNPTAQVSDFLFSASATSPTLPIGFTKFSYKGSILTNVSGNIVAFRQTGNYFEWKSVVLDQSINPVSATRTNITISVPLGISCLAVIRAGVFSTNTADFTLNLLSTYNDELIPIAGDGRTADSDIGSDINYINTTNLLIQSNTSSQISYRASSGGAVSVPFTVRTKGYFNLSL